MNGRLEKRLKNYRKGEWMIFQMKNWKEEIYTKPILI